MVLYVPVGFGASTARRYELHTLAGRGRGERFVGVGSKTFLDILNPRLCSLPEVAEVSVSKGLVVVKMSDKDLPNINLLLLSEAEEAADDDGGGGGGGRENVGYEFSMAGSTSPAPITSTVGRLFLYNAILLQRKNTLKDFHNPPGVLDVGALPAYKRYTVFCNAALTAYGVRVNIENELAKKATAAVSITDTESREETQARYERPLKSFNQIKKFVFTKSKEELKELKELFVWYMGMENAFYGDATTYHTTFPSTPDDTFVVDQQTTMDEARALVFGWLNEQPPDPFESFADVRTFTRIAFKKDEPDGSAKNLDVRRLAWEKRPRDVLRRHDVVAGTLQETKVNNRDIVFSNDTEALSGFFHKWVLDRTRFDGRVDTSQHLDTGTTALSPEFQKIMLCEFATLILWEFHNMDVTDEKLHRVFRDVPENKTKLFKWRASLYAPNGGNLQPRSAAAGDDLVVALFKGVGALDSVPAMNDVARDTKTPATKTSSGSASASMFPTSMTGLAKNGLGPVALYSLSTMVTGPQLISLPTYVTLGALAASFFMGNHLWNYLAAPDIAQDDYTSQRSVNRRISMVVFCLGLALSALNATPTADLSMQLSEQFNRTVPMTVTEIGAFEQRYLPGDAERFEALKLKEAAAMTEPAVDEEGAFLLHLAKDNALLLPTNFTGIDTYALLDLVNASSVVRTDCNRGALMPDAKTFVAPPYCAAYNRFTHSRTDRGFVPLPKVPGVVAVGGLYQMFMDQLSGMPIALLYKGDFYVWYKNAWIKALSDAERDCSVWNLECRFAIIAEKIRRTSIVQNITETTKNVQEQLTEAQTFVLWTEYARHLLLLATVPTSILASWYKVSTMGAAVTGATGGVAGLKAAAAVGGAVVAAGTAVTAALSLGAVASVGLAKTWGAHTAADVIQRNSAQLVGATQPLLVPMWFVPFATAFLRDTWQVWEHFGGVGVLHHLGTFGFETSLLYIVSNVLMDNFGGGGPLRIQSEREWASNLLLVVDLIINMASGSNGVFSVDQQAQIRERAVAGLRAMQTSLVAFASTLADTSENKPLTSEYKTSTQHTSSLAPPGPLEIYSDPLASLLISLSMRRLANIYAPHTRTIHIGERRRGLGWQKMGGLLVSRNALGVFVTTGSAAALIFAHRMFDTNEHLRRMALDVLQPR